MASVSKAASSHTTVSTGWTNPSNAFAQTSDGVFATAVTAKNATTSGDFGFADFTSSDIPDGSTINFVIINLNWGMTAAVTGGTLGVQLRNNGVALGTELTSTGTAQHDDTTNAVLSGVSLADLRSASTLLKARVRTSRGNSNTAMSGQLDFVRILVNFSPPLPAVNVRQTNARASASRRAARRLGAVAVLGLSSPWVSGSVAKPIPFGISASASVGSPSATVNRPIPIGRSITATGAGGPASGAVPGMVTVLHRKPLPRRGGGVATLGILTLPAEVASAATVVRAIPIGSSISATALDSVTPGIGSMIIPRIPRAHTRNRHPRIYLKTPVPPVSGRTAILTRAIPIGRSVTAKAQIDGSVSRVLAIGRLVRATVSTTATVNTPIPIGRSIQVVVPQGVTLSRAIPIGRSIVVTNRVDARLAQPIAIGRAISASATTSGSITLARAIPFGRSVSATVRVDATLAKPIPIGKTISATNPALATLSKAIPIGRAISATAFNSGQFVLSKPLPIGRSISVAVRVDATLSKAIPIGRAILILSPPNALPPVGEPTSALPADTGLRSVVVADAGKRAGILTDSGRRSVIVIT
jgi:hypothetical protein